MQWPRTVDLTLQVVDDGPLPDTPLQSRNVVRDKIAYGRPGEPYKDSAAVLAAIDAAAAQAASAQAASAHGASSQVPNVNAHLMHNAAAINSEPAKAAQYMRDFRPTMNSGGIGHLTGILEAWARRKRLREEYSTATKVQVELQSRVKMEEVLFELDKHIAHITCDKDSGLCKYEDDVFGVFSNAVGWKFTYAAMCNKYTGLLDELKNTSKKNKAEFPRMDLPFLVLKVKVNIMSFKEFVLCPGWLQFASTSPPLTDLMRHSWLVRDYTGNGELVPLTAGAFSTSWLAIDMHEGVELIKAALLRHGHGCRAAPGVSRVELLPKLYGAGGIITDSARFGDKQSAEYTGAVFVLKHLMTHGYTDAERKAAAVGAQQTPHTLAAAIVQLEHRRKIAATAASAAATAAATAAAALGVTATAGSSAGGSAAASGAAVVAVRNAPAASTPTPVGLEPQPLRGRGVAGLSDEARARVRAAATAAAKAGASSEEVVRAAMLSVLGHVPTAHVDAQPTRALQPPLDYGDGL